MRDEELLSGIPRVVEMVKSYGLREPEYIDMEVGVRVNFYRPSEEIRQEIRQAATQGITQVNDADNQDVNVDADNDTTQATTQVTTQATTQVIAQASTQVITQVKMLIISIGNEMLTKDEIVKLHKLGHKSNKTLIEQYFTPAIQQGYVTMLYPDKPRHPRQKYYLTEKGKELLKLIETKS